MNFLKVGNIRANGGKACANLFSQEIVKASTLNAPGFGNLEQNFLTFLFEYDANRSIVKEPNFLIIFSNVSLHSSHSVSIFEIRDAASA